MTDAYNQLSYPMNTRYLPRDSAELDLYAETYPQMAEMASVLACEHANPAKHWAVYYGLLREFKATDK